MNNIDKQYQALLQDILDNGVRKGDRTGTGTISVFGRQIRHKMSEGFPLLTTKKMAWKTMVTELLWFLRGDTNIKYLVDNDCHIWDGDAYKRYMIEDAKYMTNGSMESWKAKGFHLSKEEFIERIKTDVEFAKKWGELGPLYGKQWRAWDQYTDVCVDNDAGNGNHSGSWTFKQIDQIADAVHKLKTNPDDRGIIVSAWNTGELDKMVLRPCHNFFQVYTRELSFDERCDYAIKDGWMTELGRFDFPETRYALDAAKTPKRAISLMWNQRSVDTFLGLPFNIASYALLLEIIAKEVNMIPDELIGNLGDTHLYSNHIEQAKEQIGRELTFEERWDLAIKYGYVDSNAKMPPADSIYMGVNERDTMISMWNDPVLNMNIPKRTREPMKLPKVVHMKTAEFYKSLSEDISLISHLDPSDFKIENYQSHPSIKAPLSN